MNKIKKLNEKKDSGIEDDKQGDTEELPSRRGTEPAENLQFIINPAVVSTQAFD